MILFESFMFKTLAQYNPGAKQISMSNSDVAVSNDVFALFNNPAGMAQINWREVGIYYSPSPFGFTELANGFIAYHEPFDFGSVAVGGMTYGYELYHESKITAGTAYNYLNKVFVGIAINFHTVSIENYGNDNALYINLGGLYYLTPSFRLGFSILNLNRATFGKEKDNIPQIFNTGFSYEVRNDLTVNIAMEKDIRYNYSLRGGIEFNLTDYLSLRSGFSNEPSQYSAGLGINYSFVSLDYAFFTHKDLGLTHQAGLIISFDTEGFRNDKIRKHLGID